MQTYKLRVMTWNNQFAEQQISSRETITVQQEEYDDFNWWLAIYNERQVVGFKPTIWRSWWSLLMAMRKGSSKISGYC